MKRRTFIGSIVAAVTPLGAVVAQPAANVYGTARMALNSADVIEFTGFGAAEVCRVTRVWKDGKLIWSGAA